MEENEIKKDMPKAAPAEAAAVNTAPAPDEEKDEGSALLRQLGELRHELEDMRRELASAKLPDKDTGKPLPNAAELSAGRLRGAGDSLYSPAEVRAMSRAEVRANLERIQESMRHWG